MIFSVIFSLRATVNSFGYLCAPATPTWHTVRVCVCVWMVWRSVWMAFEVKQHMATLSTITCQWGRVGRRKELKHGDAAMDEQLFGYRIGCTNTEGAWHGGRCRSHSREHTRSTLPPDEPFPDLKCQTRFGCITFEVGRSEARETEKRKSNGKWKIEKNFWHFIEVQL